MIHLKVGGRVQGYKGLTFVTIRGAGHEVALLQRSRFLQMLRVFLADKSLPATPYV
jgi:serine carboxypeptidase-like clade 2